MSRESVHAEVACRPLVVMVALLTASTWGCGGYKPAPAPGGGGGSGTASAPQGTTKPAARDVADASRPGTPAGGAASGGPTTPSPAPGALPDAGRAAPPPSPAASESRTPPEKVPPTPIKPSVPPPTAAFLFQPVFELTDGRTVTTNAGFFTRTAKGQVIAATSTEYIEIKDRVYDSATWVTVSGGRAVASSRRSWGPPGKGIGVVERPKTGPRDSGSSMDFRGCYLLLPMEQAIPKDVVLEMDERDKPEIGEPVWVPKKDPSKSVGYELLEAKVTAATELAVQVSIPQRSSEPITRDSLKPVMDALTASAGAPVISQSTGKVIGLVSSLGGMPTSRTVWTIILDLAPAKAIRAALNNATETPLLSSVTGLGWPKP